MSSDTVLLWMLQIDFKTSTEITVQKENFTRLQFCQRFLVDDFCSSCQQIFNQGTEMKERIKYQYSDNLLETEQLHNSAICLSIGFTVCTILHSKVVLLFKNRYLSKLRIS